jgi:hypothetical protein
MPPDFFIISPRFGTHITVRDHQRCHIDGIDGGEEWHGILVIFGIYEPSMATMERKGRSRNAKPSYFDRAGTNF